MNIETYSALLKINKHALDEELVTHSDVQFRIAEQINKMSEFHAAEVDELKKVEAEAFAAQKMVLDNGKPLSDTRAEMRARTDPHRMKAWTNMTAAKSDLDRWQKLYDAWIGKGHNMKQLVALYCTGNFSVSLGQPARPAYTEAPAVTRRRAGGAP